MNKTKLNISVVFLLTAMLVGTLLRMQFIYPLAGLNFRNFLHGHTHVALLGWGFNAIFLGVLHAYSPTITQKKYNILFWFVQFTVVGALISFPIQGYAAVSITFSTLFLFASYWFYGLFRNTSSGDVSIGAKFLRWGMFFLLLSSVGPWSLGAIMAKGLRDTIWYPMSIYFYLHFLYNGFILYCIYGLVFKQFDKLKISYDGKKAKLFFILTNISIFPTMALSATWINAGYWVNIIGLTGGLIQLIALVFFILMIKEVKAILVEKIGKFLLKLFSLFLIALILKTVMQFISGFQLMADLAFQTKPFTIIGYIHLVMLGVITLFLIGYFIQIGMFHIHHMVTKIGLLLFIIGFILSEMLLFGQGAMLMIEWDMLPSYYHLLFYSSALMPIGLILFYVTQFIFQSKKSKI